MTADDLAVVVRGVAPVLREFVDVQTKALKDKIADLEQRLAVAEAIKSAEPVDLDALALKAAELIDKPKDGEPGQNGTSVTVADVEPVIAAEVAKAIAALPVPVNGEDGDPGAPGQNGKDVDMVAVQTAIDARLEKAIAEIELPKDGVSVTVEDVAPLIASEVEKAVKALPVPHNGKDGVGLTDALVDREGHLILALSDGRTKDVGLVVGKDVDMDAVMVRVASAIDNLPKPKDGKDGVSYTDVRGHVDERGFFLHFDGPLGLKEIPIPATIYRGVFKEGEAYSAGDSVTWGGSSWIAMADTSARPGLATEESRAWRLSVKKGGDGKPGLPGPQGNPGPKGDKGLDGLNAH